MNGLLKFDVCSDREQCESEPLFDAYVYFAMWTSYLGPRKWRSKFTKGEERADVAATLTKMGTRLRQGRRVPQTQLVLRAAPEQDKEVSMIWIPVAEDPSSSAELHSRDDRDGFG